MGFCGNFVLRGGERSEFSNKKEVTVIYCLMLRNGVFVL